MDSIELSRIAGRLRKLSDRDKSLISKLKRKETKAEGKLWDLVRNRQLSGLKFRRQHKIGKFIVDFFCAEKLLAVEVDGAIHAYRVKEDEARSRWLESLGIRVIRFSNEMVLEHPEVVLKEIEGIIASVRSQ